MFVTILQKYAATDNDNCHGFKQTAMVLQEYVSFCILINYVIR